LREDGNQGDPVHRRPRGWHLRTSLTSEESGMVDRESEASIVAMNSGNAEGTKGRRFRITK
jgi:hypothetical protein